MVIFTEADFLWNKRLAPYKKVIVAGVNKVYRDNESCAEIDPTSAYISDGRGTKGDPVFFVTCGTPPTAFNVYFSKTQIEDAISSPGRLPVDREEAVAACQYYARSNTKPPSNIDLMQASDLKVVPGPYRRVSITASFTAKSEFNASERYTVRCLVGANGLIDAMLKQAR